MPRKAEASWEALELILPDGGSVVLTSGTDWTLRIEEGSWPDLPGWCYPPQSWSALELDAIPSALGRFRKVAPAYNQHSELVGTRIAFAGGAAVTVRTGEQFRLELVLSHPG
ncbi:hypothetical protein FHS42_001586 [Streptomyces zagrosensis]|uniref:Uncharacterized protein n=1 Tax=Streptomyces zagrosensis TaxID=1042984 RepID=A0A7W9Q706_9ACTN|nr:hypothetical protein [Streptomyces zagrosensis]